MCAPKRGHVCKGWRAHACVHISPHSCAHTRSCAGVHTRVPVHTDEHGRALLCLCLCARAHSPAARRGQVPGGCRVPRCRGQQPLRPQPKQFRKMIQQTFQQYALLREEECILKFLHTLATFANIDQESYRCELIVSPQEGIGGHGLDPHPAARVVLKPPPCTLNPARFG